MPLVEPDNTEILKVTCMCGEDFLNHNQFFAHVGKCRLTRCASCLQVLNSPELNDDRFDDVSTHQCPSIRLAELQRGFTHA